MWDAKPACRDKEDLFIEPDAGRLPRTKEWQAKEICQSCPILMQCRKINDSEEVMTDQLKKFVGFYSCIYAGETPAERWHRRALAQRRDRA